MNLILTLEHRFQRTPDGKIWTQVAFSYDKLEIYLKVFDQVSIVARVSDVDEASLSWIRADGPCVRFSPVPYYIGPNQYIQRVSSIRKSIQTSISLNDAVLMRIPSQLATLAASLLRARGQPYGVHVVGDPFEVFTVGSIDHPLRRFFRLWFAWQQKRQCAEACTVAYVTKHTLQKRYPASKEAFSTNFSDVVIDDTTDFVDYPRVRFASKPYKLISVASMDQIYKGLDDVIDAVAICVNRGLDVTLTLVGDGKFRPQLEAQVAALGLTERIHFLGQLTAGKAVYDQIEAADLFVLASKTEGLPRALIEAMAHGLPCIGSTAGGIPELLMPEDLIPPANPTALANKIHEVGTNQERMLQMSIRNLERAREYSSSILNQRRIEFLQILKQRTNAWKAK